MIIPTNISITPSFGTKGLVNLPFLVTLSSFTPASRRISASPWSPHAVLLYCWMESAFILFPFLSFPQALCQSRFKKNLFSRVALTAQPFYCVSLGLISYIYYNMTHTMYNTYCDMLHIWSFALFGLTSLTE